MSGGSKHSTLRYKGPHPATGAHLIGEGRNILEAGVEMIVVKQVASTERTLEPPDLQRFPPNEFCSRSESGHITDVAEV